MTSEKAVGWNKQIEREIDWNVDGVACLKHGKAKNLDLDRISHKIFYLFDRGPGWGKLTGAAGLGWFIGSKFHVRTFSIFREANYGTKHDSHFATTTTCHSLRRLFQCRRQKKKLDLKFKNEQKALYQQYYEDVYSLQIQNAELIQALEQLGYKVSK